MHIPPPPMYPDLADVDDDLTALALVQAHEAAVRDHQFKYVWLPTVVTPEEYARVYGFQVSMLAELFPHVYRYGPYGDVWMRYGAQLLRVLDDALAGEAYATAFLWDFVDAYDAAGLPVDALRSVFLDRREVRARFGDEMAYVESGFLWDLLVEHAVNLRRSADLGADVELDEDAVWSQVGWHGAWSFIFADRGAQARLLLTFAALVRGRDLLQPHGEFARVLSVHDAFLRTHAWFGVAR